MAPTLLSSARKAATVLTCGHANVIFTEMKEAIAEFSNSHLKTTVSSPCGWLRGSLEDPLQRWVVIAKVLRLLTAKWITQNNVATTHLIQSLLFLLFLFLYDAFSNTLCRLVSLRFTRLLLTLSYPRMTGKFQDTTCKSLLFLGWW